LEDAIMSEYLKQRAGLLVATVLGLDSLLHVYWATGALWPAHDTKTLSQAILNVDVPFTLPVLGTLAFLLSTAALTALAWVDLLGELGRRCPDSLLQVGVLTVAAGLLAKGLVGVVQLVTVDTGTLYYRLNATIYTPVCFVLFGAAVAAARFDRHHGRLRAIFGYGG
jgi:hypothetical protein